MKVQRGITIDKNVDTELRKRPHINVSALVNEYLKKHLEENKMNYPDTVTKTLNLLPPEIREIVESKQEQYLVLNEYTTKFSDSPPYFKREVDYIKLDALIRKESENAGIIWEENKK